MAVPQTLVVFFYDLGPGKAVGMLDPAVGLAQTLGVQTNCIYGIVSSIPRRTYEFLTPKKSFYLN